jgi:hypothetical protein
MKRTPGPWKLEVEYSGPDETEGSMIWIPEINRQLFDTEWAEPDEWDLSLANAEYIVRACNSHDALLAALRIAEWGHRGRCAACGRTRAEGHNMVCRVGAAIAKAEGR